MIPKLVRGDTHAWPCSYARDDRTGDTGRRPAGGVFDGPSCAHAQPSTSAADMFELVEVRQSAGDVDFVAKRH